jgi:hypothetical protein
MKLFYITTGISLYDTFHSLRRTNHPTQKLNFEGHKILMISGF